MAEANRNVIPFAFEDRLVRAVQKDGEPWFVGKDVCEVLQIKNHNHALGRLHTDERGAYSVVTPSKGVANDDPLSVTGNEQTVIIVSEPGVYRLIFTSRSTEAERFKRWLAHEVLPAIRKTGRYHAPDDPGAPQLHLGNQADRFEVTDEAVSVLRIKLDLVNSARRLWGHDRAKGLWLMLDLPHMLEVQTVDQDDAEQLISTLHFGMTDSGRQVGELITRAFEDDDEAAQELRRNGVLVDTASETIGIANNHPAIRRFLKGTRWEKSHWRTLRRAHGAVPGLTARFGGQHSRMIVIPVQAID